LNYIDEALLNATEWCCRRFQVLTGRTNVWLAFQLTNLSIIVYFVWALTYFWTQDLSTRVFVGLFCSGVFYALTQTIFKVPVEEYETQAYRRVAKGFRNPRRVRDTPLRMSFLTMTVLLPPPTVFVYLTRRSSVVLLSYLLIVLTTVLLYLLACDPLPPCAGKLKEWLRGLAPARLAAPEAPTPE